MSPRTQGPPLTLIEKLGPTPKFKHFFPDKTQVNVVQLKRWHPYSFILASIGWLNGVHKFIYGTYYL